MEDAAVLFALLTVGLILAVPVTIIILFRRQRKLRLRLDEDFENHTRQNDALHRELLDLKRQLGNLQQTAAIPSQPISRVEDESYLAHFEVAGAVREQISQSTEIKESSTIEIPVQTKPPDAEEIAVIEKPAVSEKPVIAEPLAPAEKHEIPASISSSSTSSVHEVAPAAASTGETRFCGWCGTVHDGGAEKCPSGAAVLKPSYKDQVEPSATERKAPVPDSLVSAARDAKPSTPSSPVPAKSDTPPITPAAKVPVSQPSAAARVVAPPLFAALQTPSPTSPGKRIKSVFALEETLGRNWLNKLGITLLVIGIASFGIYELGQVGPVGKDSASYAAAIGLLSGGIFFERRERYRILGHTLIGGGWALLFFTSYALYNVTAMRVLSSELPDLVLMLIVAAVMVVHTLRYRSQLVTGVSFLLAFSTVAMSHDTVYSLSAGVVLSIGLVGIVLKMGWYELEVFGILSSYLNHLYWLYRILGAGGAQGHNFPDYLASTALLLFYWTIFRVSYVVRKIKSSTDENMSTVAALLNTLLLLGTMKFQSVHPELAFYALLAIGAIEFSIAQLPVTKRRREAFVFLTILGTALMVTAIPFRYSGNNVSILWLVGAEALLLAGAIFDEVVFRRLGLLAGLLVGGHLVGIDFRQLMAARQSGEAIVLPAGMTFALCAVVFYLNSLFVAQRWRLFANRPDPELLILHSYIGAFAAVSASWALCANDWTALSFAATMVVLAGVGRALKSPALRTSDLQAQYGVIGCLALYRIAIFNLHTEVLRFTHVQSRLITLPILAAMFYLTAKWSALRDNNQQRTFRDLFAFAGTLLVTGLIYFEVPELWQPFAAILFAVILLEVSQKLPYYAFVWHAHILSALAVASAVTTDPDNAHLWQTIPLHAVTALPVVAGLYWIAKRAKAPNPQQANIGRAAYTWVATGLMAWVLFEAAPAPWTGVAWVGFAIAMAMAIRVIRYNHLAWQANALAAAAIVRTFTFNYSLTEEFWAGFSLRLVTVSLVAAGVYFLSRKAIAREAESARPITYVHTFSATSLLTLLAWYEAPGPWLAAVWAVFALVLAIIDRRFEMEDLGWQAHVLAALALVRSVVVNLHVTDTWHGISVRLLSLAIVAFVLYALSRLIRIPDIWLEQDFHHVYSWAASALVSVLVWYELQPITVAIAWAVFGLVLFEYGLMRNVKQFRFQSYVALSAAFGRIFFSNLTAGNPGELWSPRIYTVLPIALILFFIYSQIGEKSSQEDSRLRFDQFLAYLGTGTVVALLYFEFQNDWLVAAWASVVFSLFVVAFLLERAIFLYQALLLTLGSVVRGIMHNLFGASYFNGGTWTGRFLVLGSGIAMLLACLPFAFRLRGRWQPRFTSRRWLAAVASRPEQFMFFAPVTLLTLMLALKMRAGMVTVSWGLEGLVIILVAIAVNERSFRLTGLILLLICVGKVLLMDAWGLAPRDRYVTFIILGAALLAVSFLYSKYRDTIRQFL